MKKELVFVDSNIWLYSLLPEKKDKKFGHILNFLTKIAGESYLVISTQVINEMTYNLKKNGHFSEEKIREIINQFNSQCIVIEFNLEILLQASELRENHQFSFWDSLIVASALKSGCKILYTEDMNHGMIVEDTLKIINPLKSL